MRMNKQKPRKNPVNKRGGFFRAFFFGAIVCAAMWVLLSAVLALVMLNMEDSHAPGFIFSFLIPAISLFAGGFASGKIDKPAAVPVSVALGAAFLVICYTLSASLSLSRGMGGVMKSVAVVIMLVCPLLGARVSARNNRRNIAAGKRM